PATPLWQRQQKTPSRLIAEDVDIDRPAKTDPPPRHPPSAAASAAGAMATLAPRYDTDLQAFVPETDDGVA
ncbi:hypothetical protein, partial [Gordonia amicalis]|uniref:hypothetical protein n=1 Tax=Gordonia amicalis TaxID=89053 RepID=UPI0024B8F8CC